MRIARIVDAKDRVLHVCEKNGALFRIEGDILGGDWSVTKEEVTARRWLSPIEPRTILCIGLNYRRHAEEGGAPIPEYPVLFMKNPCAATGHMEPIRLPKVCKEEVDYEAELAVIIGSTARDLPKDKALDCVLGYTAANDVSARIWQSQLGGSQWCRGKSFDGFAPMGPVLVTKDELTNPNALTIRGELNGAQVQSSNTSDMIFDVPTLISFLSQDTTLLPGTVILTGTPEGVGWARNPKLTLKNGDTITIEIETIGKLTNPVVK